MEEEQEAHYLRMVEEFKGTKLLVKNATDRLNKFKKELSDLVEDQGHTDHDGHKWFHLGDHKLKRERRLSKSFDIASATDWAKEEGHWDDVKVVSESLDEDKLLALAWDDEKIRDAVLCFYVEKEIWAFKA
jgi:hypothetical protein